jgi:hypothetical protein
MLKREKLLFYSGKKMKKRNKIFQLAKFELEIKFPFPFFLSLLISDLVPRRHTARLVTTTKKQRERDKTFIHTRIKE